MDKVDAIQLSKDIAASRELTITYNERVLSQGQRGIISTSEYHEHIQHHKAIELRVLEWREEWKN